MKNTYIVIYDTAQYKRWCVVHAPTPTAAADFVKAMPGVERVSNVRGPVQEYTA